MQDDARTKLGLVFTIMAYFSFSALNALPGIIADRAVYYYQRDGKYYKPLPYLLPICGAYYFVRFAFPHFDSSCTQLTAHHAFVFPPMLQMTRAFNRFIACIAPDLNAAQGISPVFTALSVLFGGYMITRVRTQIQIHQSHCAKLCATNNRVCNQQTQVPGWWIWA